MPGSPFGDMTAALGSAFARVVELLLGFWRPGTADPSLAAAAGIARQVGQYAGPLTVTTATIGVVVAGTRLAVASSRAAEPARDLARGLGVLAVVWWGGAVAIRTLGQAFDDAGAHLLAGAGVGAGTVTGLESVLRTLAVTDPGLVFLLCLLGALSGLVQFVLLLLREPALALLAGALPVAAGAAVGGRGRAPLHRLLAWTAALTSYKFVAALVYAVAFGVVGSADDLTGVVAGIALVAVAVAALPALVRLLTPALEAALVPRGGGLADGTPLASGAVLLAPPGQLFLGAGLAPDAAPLTRPGLLAPSGSGPAPLEALRRPPVAPTRPTDPDRPDPEPEPRPGTPADTEGSASAAGRRGAR